MKDSDCGVCGCKFLCEEMRNAAQRTYKKAVILILLIKKERDVASFVICKRKDTHSAVKEGALFGRCTRAFRTSSLVFVKK